MTMHHNEQLPLGIVPMLSLGDARFADVDRNLPAIGGMYQFRKTATFIHIHLHDILEIIKAYQHLWEIERSFRITKSTLEAEPVFVSKENRIDAHFLTCFLSLLIIRLLEKNLNHTFSPEQIIESLSQANVAFLGENLYRNLYYDKVLASLTTELELPFDNENFTSGTLKKLIAKSKKH